MYGRCAFGTPTRPISCFLISAALLASLLAPTSIRAEGFLQGLRDTIRIAPAKSSEPEPEEKKEVVEHRHYHYHYGRGPDDDETSGLSDLYAAGFMVAGIAAASPWWGPHVALGDDLKSGGFFPRFPYDDAPGYMMIGPKDIHARPCALDYPPALRNDLFEPWPTHPRRWSGRFRAEYADDFNDVNRFGGHLLLSTASRWGIDTQMDFLRESLREPMDDQLRMGDFNVVLRFAQNEQAQFRTGIGFNWLDDSLGSDFGFNFTYGADFFPRPPWVVSAALDWGTLGHSELFRIRTTAGLVVHGVEVYAGYEYLDIDGATLNNLLAGVRIWF
jgi:hypothetical protein